MTNQQRQARREQQLAAARREIESQSAAPDLETATATADAAPEAETVEANTEAPAAPVACMATVSAPRVTGPDTPENPPVPVKGKREKAAASVFGVDEKALKHFAAHEHAQEKQKSLDAIQQAVTDAQRIAEDRIKRDPVTVALLEDPGDGRKRLAFLEKFGPSNVIPPKPPATPFGRKDPALMQWMATYHPDEFVAEYGSGQSPLLKSLLEGIRRKKAS